MKQKLIIKKVQIIICIFLISKSGIAQQNFDTLVDFNNYVEFPYSVNQTQDSGYIFITSGDDYPQNTYWIEFNKLNKDGSIAFQKFFGFPGYQCYVGFSGSLKPTYDGGLAFGGSIAQGNDGNGLFVKYNFSGDTEFVKTIGDTSSDVFYDCIQTSDSGFVFVGDRAKYSPDINNDFWILKTDAQGNKLWEHTLGTNNDEQAFHVIENSRHQLIVSGAKESANPIHYPYAAIYDLQGNLVTTKSFNQGALTCAGGAVWHYGAYEYTLIGCLDTIINTNDASYPQYIARLDSSFNFKWRTVYNSPEIKNIFIDKETSDEGIVLVGNKVDSSTGWPVGWIAKVDSSGNKLWEHFYTRNSNRLAAFTDFQETFDHGFIICGETYGDSSHSQDSWIVKLDSNGCLDNTCVINTGTHELMISGLEFTVFPNPASQYITISMNEEKGTLILFDLPGKEVMRKNTEHEKQITVDVSAFKNGVYLLQFITEKKVFTSKVVKE